MFADIATGNTDAADVFFLIAVICGALGAAIHVASVPYARIAHALVAAAVTLIALGFLLL